MQFHFRPGKERHCPHCGKIISGAGIGLAPVLALVIAGVFFALWSRISVPAARAPGSTAASGCRLPDGVADYIVSTEAEKACGACLASASGFLAKKPLSARNELAKDMVLLPAGNYEIGSPENTGDPDEHPRHQIRLDAYYIDKYEVTAKDYMEFAQNTGGHYPEWAQPKGDFNIDTGRDPYYKPLAAVLKLCAACPVVGVEHKDAEAYCRHKNKRLPTEAEWETAARGGESGDFSFDYSSATAGDYYWNKDNSAQKPNPVGSKLPNKYGLYDMHGNVCEWVSDFYDRTYYAGSPGSNPKGPPSGTKRVIRGGSWALDANSMRSGNRAGAGSATDDIGFRCALQESALYPVTAP